MRVALISNWAEPIGGAQHYVMGLAARLAPDHEVLLLSGSRDLSLPGVRCVHVPHLRTLEPHESPLRKSLWHLRDQWRPSVHRAIGHALTEFGPDVVHSHEPQGLSAAVFSASTGPPHVHTAHDLNLFCVRIAMTVEGIRCGGRCAPCLLQRNVRARLASRAVDRLIAPSEYVRDFHVRAGVVSLDASAVVRQPASEGSARVRSGDGHSPRIGFIGNLTLHKGVRTLLEAFGSAPDGWRLAVAGTGVLADEVRAAAARDRRIEFVGPVSEEEKDRFLDGLDLLLVPSECEENAPRVAAEAAVRGLPTIVSDRGGLPETPEAAIFRAGDPGALVAAVRSMVQPPERLAHASERLLQARQAFLWPVHLRLVEEQYAMTLGARAHVRRPAT
jgi:glycosyltransferase involved in cell wall biosynthesis